MLAELCWGGSTLDRDCKTRRHNDSWRVPGPGDDIGQESVNRVIEWNKLERHQRLYIVDDILR